MLIIAIETAAPVSVTNALRQPLSQLMQTDNPTLAKLN